MARRKQDPLLQAAQGFPGRRKKSVEREIEAAAQAAAKEPMPATGPYPVPAVFLEAPTYWREAIKIWQEKADSLRASGRQRPAFMSGLVRYCMWTQLFITSVVQLRRDLPKGGVSIKVKKGDGETVIRTHPSIDFMGKAETAMRLLEAEYGFTPYSDTNLTRVETFNAGQGRQPYLPGMGPGAGAGQDASDDLDPSDLMNQADSVPPSQSVN
ncbi:P27 family phage terminase small subunit [Kaistia defluvii]|uniref:Phage terminase small subunit n=1 Tax=Kaistia defluvii TaxID=410841 RepID=A0ABV2R4X7_9HYPH